MTRLAPLRHGAALTVALAVLLAGCGSDDPEATSAGSAGAAGDPAGQAYAAGLPACEEFSDGQTLRTEFEGCTVNGEEQLDGATYSDCAGGRGLTLSGPVIGFFGEPAGYAETGSAANSPLLQKYFKECYPDSILNTPS